MATFKIETRDAKDETVDADLVIQVEGHFEFQVRNNAARRTETVFVIPASYVRTIRRESKSKD